MSLQEVTLNLKGHQHCSTGHLKASCHLSHLRQAAVLVPLFQTSSGEVRVLLTQRSNKLRSHPGETCFPGGKVDDTCDTDHIACALRETREELGVEEERIHVIGCLPAVLSKHFLCVVPVVARIQIDGLILQPNRDEVEHVFSVPLQMFLSTDFPNSKYSWYDGHWGDDVMFRVHQWEYMVTRSVIQDTGMTMLHTPYEQNKRMTRKQARINSPDTGKTFVIWGLTAAVLIQTAMIAFKKPPSFEVIPPGDDRYCILSDITVENGRIVRKG